MQQRAIYCKNTEVFTAVLIFNYYIRIEFLLNASAMIHCHSLAII